MLADRIPPDNLNFGRRHLLHFSGSLLWTEHKVGALVRQRRKKTEGNTQFRAALNDPVGRLPHHARQRAGPLVESHEQFFVFEYDFRAGSAGGRGRLGAEIAAFRDGGHCGRPSQSIECSPVHCAPLAPQIALDDRFSLGIISVRSRSIRRRQKRNIERPQRDSRDGACSPMRSSMGCGSSIFSWAVCVRFSRK